MRQPFTWFSAFDMVIAWVFLHPFLPLFARQTLFLSQLIVLAVYALLTLLLMSDALFDLLF